MALYVLARGWRYDWKRRNDQNSKHEEEEESEEHKKLLKAAYGKGKQTYQKMFEEKENERSLVYGWVVYDRVVGLESIGRR